MKARVKKIRFYAEEAKNDLGAYVELINKDVMCFLDGVIQRCDLLIAEKEQYRTPQWHYVVLWAGFAFITGLLLGAGLMAG